MGKNNNYRCSINCELVITSDFVTPVEITKMVGLEATRTYTKGDVFKSRSSGTEGKRSINLWAKKSDITLTDEENISIHIQYFRDILKNKIEIIRQLKRDTSNEISFWVWIDSDNSGVGVELSEKDLSFMNEIVNRLHFTVIPSISRSL